MKVFFVCPFDLNQLTGTPIRAQTTIRAAEQFAYVVVAASDRTTRLAAFIYRSLRVLRREKPDIVHCLTTLAILPALLHKLIHPHVKIVFEMHGWSWFETAGRMPRPKRIVFLILDYVGLWFSSLVIAMSYSGKKFLVRRTRKPKRIVVQWCPVEFPSQFEPPRQGKSLRVGYIGNNSWWQGLSYLIDAAQLLENRPDLSFVIAGLTPEDESTLPHPSNVSYPGKIPRDQVAAFLHSCDVLVSPRLKGPASDLQFPQKFSEYLSAGRLVIASDVSDQAQVLKEAGCGLVVNPLNADNLARTIVSFANLPLLERRLCGERAFSYARRHFLFGVMVRNLRGFYSRILK